MQPRMRSDVWGACGGGGVVKIRWWCNALDSSIVEEWKELLTSRSGGNNSHICSSAPHVELRSSAHAIAVDYMRSVAAPCRTSQDESALARANLNSPLQSCQPAPRTGAIGFVGRAGRHRSDGMIVAASADTLSCFQMLFSHLPSRLVHSYPLAPLPACYNHMSVRETR